jgi:hypothetical protein
MMTFEEALACGADRYADGVRALGDEGSPATLTRTGGRCAALAAQLGRPDARSRMGLDTICQAMNG